MPSTAWNIVTALLSFFLFLSFFLSFFYAFRNVRSNAQVRIEPLWSVTSSIWTSWNETLEVLSSHLRWTNAVETHRIEHTMNGQMRISWEREQHLCRPDVRAALTVCSWWECRAQWFAQWVKFFFGSAIQTLTRPSPRGIPSQKWSRSPKKQLNTAASKSSTKPSRGHT